MRRKTFSFSFSHFLVALISVMFPITIFLSFKLLTIDSCNTCPSIEVQNEVIVHSNEIQRKPLSKSNNHHKLAILVPFRDRFEELLEFVPYMHSFLNNQRIDFHIFILNQVDQYRFNRASLINVGYLEVNKNYNEDFDYFVMHDVDLLPLNKNLSYTYPEQPFHLAAPNLHPRYHYAKFIGGILLINKEQFALVNGLSNKYWGWGLEDDEFYVRLKDAKLTVSRPVNITTGANDTFRHIHGKHRKRDTTKCYNQREVTRRRDRNTGLHNVKYNIQNYKKMTIDGNPFTIINIELMCDFDVTPWCNCDLKKV